jgi:prepilin peptidase CpaA
LLKEGLWIVAALFAAIAGFSDWRSRRIPNWLTVPGLAIGLAANTWLGGWQGLRFSLLGAGLGLLLLLPFVLVRSLGAGDWKFAGALGSFLGPTPLLDVLVITIVIAGLMALGVILWKHRVRQTARNIGKILRAYLSLHLPGQEFSLENPESSKIPFGVAMSLAAIFYTVRIGWGGF